MKMYTYVNFPGVCAEAFGFYEKLLGGKIATMMTHAQSPQPTPVSADWQTKVLHARISVGDTVLLGADIPNAQPMRSAYLTLMVDSDAEAERIYAALSEHGEVFMPLQETFFATRFGQLRDRFGLNWMLICERPATTSATSDVETLRVLNADYIASVQRGDVRRFREILADDFSASLGDGTLVDKRSFLEATARPVTISNLEAHDVQIRVLGDVAVIHGHTSFTTADGRAATGRYTDVWARRGGRWLAIAAHVTRN